MKIHTHTRIHTTKHTDLPVSGRLIISFFLSVIHRQKHFHAHTCFYGCPLFKCLVTHMRAHTHLPSTHSHYRRCVCVKTGTRWNTTLLYNDVCNMYCSNLHVSEDSKWNYETEKKASTASCSCALAWITSPWQEWLVSGSVSTNND